MNLEKHLAELKRKHFMLDEAIISEQKRPAACTLEITKLKKQKLFLKQQIESKNKKYKIENV